MKFLTFINKANKKIKRFQYTAIDDAIRIRVLKTYKTHNQLTSIDFINYVIEHSSLTKKSRIHLWLLNGVKINNCVDCIVLLNIYNEAGNNLIDSGLFIVDKLCLRSFVYYIYLS